MPSPEPRLLLILLCCATSLLLVLVLMLWRISRSLARIERALAMDAGMRNADEAAAGTTGGGAFETFLNEEPERRVLPKSEQFAAYRRWRQEKGLNWSKP
jgi:hypothetical protein